MMLSVDVVNRKVVDNFHILLVLEFHDFMPTSLGVIEFTIPCQVLPVLCADLKVCDV